MNQPKKHLNTFKQLFARQPRDARYVILGSVALLIYIATHLQALDAGLFDSLERPVFEFFNSLPDVLYPVFLSLTQFGGLGSLFVWAAIGWIVVNRKVAIQSITSGILGWFIAKILKNIVARGRPDAFFDSLTLFHEAVGGYGFPSGHATFAAASATVLLYQVPKRYRKYIVLIVFLVGLSRMFLGVHFPLDVLGGWALGAVIGSLVVLLSGTSNKGLSSRRLKSYMIARGYSVKSLRVATVDARGSRPVNIELADGTVLFGKIFGRHEHAADWLFKIHRFFLYKNLQAEEPYANIRRNTELEALSTLWAKEHGVRTARVVDILHVGSAWVLLQEKIKGAESLPEKNRIRQTSLEDVWRQVSILHEGNLAHRDLRAANIMIDTSGKAWLIDFGFSEVAPRKQRINMDNAELLMSMSLVVGTERTFAAAHKHLTKTDFKHVLPYLQKAVFSGETTRQLKQNKQLLEDLKTEIKSYVGVHDIEEADITRIGLKTVINFVLVGVFLYVVVPQLEQFRGSLGLLEDIHLVWIVPIAAAGLLTYVLTALTYVILSDIPLRLWRTIMVQLAGSFFSKFVPGGIGNNSTNLRYLMKAGVDKVDAGAVIFAQNAIGFASFFIPLLLFLLLSGGRVLESFDFSLSIPVVLAVITITMLSALAIVVFKSLRRRVVRLVTSFVTRLRDISTSPQQLSWSLAASFGISLMYITSLYFCFLALGISLGALDAVTVYISGIIAKSTIPVPGGLGPLEVAMAASMVGLGVDKPLAFAAVILYRLATYWSPIPFSYAAYRRLQSQNVL